MFSGPILNTMIGAGIKLGANVVNGWLASREEQQRIIAARDKQMFDAAVQQQ